MLAACLRDNDHAAAFAERKSWMIEEPLDAPPT
jgi:hypothetical protein